MSVSAFPYGTMSLKGPAYSLSGTTGSPNVATTITTFPDDASAGWDFRLDGRVQKVEATSSFFNEGTEWTDAYPGETGDTWIRATNDAGSNPDSGPALGTWHTLGNGATNSWRWVVTGAGTSQGTLKIEIATDSGGSNIVATGYYRGVATANTP
jgi:hypothetical protein